MKLEKHQFSRVGWYTGCFPHHFSLLSWVSICHGAIYLSQTLQFKKPVYPGDKVVASVTVININNNKKQVTLKCEAKVGDKLVIKGEAVALAPSRGEN